MIFTRPVLTMMGQTAARLDHEDNLKGVSRSSANPSNYWRMLQVLEDALDSDEISFAQHHSYSIALNDAYEQGYEKRVQAAMSPIEREMERVKRDALGR